MCIINKIIVNIKTSCYILRGNKFSDVITLILL